MWLKGEKAQMCVHLEMNYLPPQLPMLVSSFGTRVSSCGDETSSWLSIEQTDMWKSATPAFRIEFLHLSFTINHRAKGLFQCQAPFASEKKNGKWKRYCGSFFEPRHSKILWLIIGWLVWWHLKEMSRRQLTLLLRSERLEKEKPRGNGYVASYCCFHLSFFYSAPFRPGMSLPAQHQCTTGHVKHPFPEREKREEMRHP